MVPKVQAKMDFMMKIEGLNEAMNRVAGVTRMRMQARLMMDGREKTRASRRDLRPKKFATLTPTFHVHGWRECGASVAIVLSCANRHAMMDGHTMRKKINHFSSLNVH